MNQLGKILSNLGSSFREFIHGLMKKPISLAITLVALGLLSLTLAQIVRGSLYVARLNYVDVTTMAMVSLLLLRAVTRLYSASDLETVSIALTSSLSFIFGYEAIYKWSFYFLPWRMSAPELREFSLQIAIASIVLTGFAQKVFELRRGNLALLGLFAVSWLFWLAIGFPQLWDSLNFYDPVLEIPMTWGMIYALNRFTKFIWFMFYFCLYTRNRSKSAA